MVRPTSLDSVVPVDRRAFQVLPARGRETSRDRGCGGSPTAATEGLASTIGECIAKTNRLACLLLDAF